MTMIGTERPDTEVETILGVDTHLDFHVAVAVDHASLATGENEPVGRGRQGPSSPIRRAYQRRGCERVQNSAGAGVCPECRVAPRLDADQDTKDEH